MRSVFVDTIYTPGSFASPCPRSQPVFGCPVALGISAVQPHSHIPSVSARRNNAQRSHVGLSRCVDDVTRASASITVIGGSVSQTRTFPASCFIIRIYTDHRDRRNRSLASCGIVLTGQMRMRLRKKRHAATTATIRLLPFPVTQFQKFN
jgi:hypothetical protein